MRCDQCKFYLPYKEEELAKRDGICRVKAPVFIQGYDGGVWPDVSAHWWCGQFQPKPEHRLATPEKTQ